MFLFGALVACNSFGIAATLSQQLGAYSSGWSSSQDAIGETWESSEWQVTNLCVCLDQRKVAVKRCVGGCCFVYRFSLHEADRMLILNDCGQHYARRRCLFLPLFFIIYSDNINLRPRYMFPWFSHTFISISSRSDVAGDSYTSILNEGKRLLVIEWPSAPVSWLQAPGL